MNDEHVLNIVYHINHLHLKWIAKIEIGSQPIAECPLGVWTKLLTIKVRVSSRFHYIHLQLMDKKKPTNILYRCECAIDQHAIFFTFPPFPVWKKGLFGRQLEAFRHWLHLRRKWWRESPSKWGPFGGFLKWWYPTTMGFPTKNHHFWGVLGIPPFKEIPISSSTPLYHVG